MTVLTRFLCRLAVVAALVAALAAIGLGHRIAAPEGPAMQAFLLAGGDLADLCATGGDEGDRAEKGDCPACRILADPHVPTVAPVGRDADLVRVAAVAAPRESRAVRPILDPAHGLRAPPLA